MGALFRGSLTFFTTYRPTVKTDIYSSPPSPNSKDDEICLTDQVSYNYTGQSIPPHALKLILQQPIVSSAFPSGIVEDVDRGLVSGLVFVSERNQGLETLHFSIRHNMGQPKVFQFSDVYNSNNTFGDVRMEDSGCFAGDCLIYVSTKEPAPERRQPWTAVYRTNLKTGETTRLTPQGVADLNPAVSPCGKKIAVASFEGKPGGWDGEIEYQNTNIFVMNIEESISESSNLFYNRKLVVEGGGWPTWGSQNVLYFHKFEKDSWGVFRVELSNTSSITRVTPDSIHAFTPAALSDTKVAVVTIRDLMIKFEDEQRKVEQYRHVEIFEYPAQEQKESIRITQRIKDKANHYNPFVIPGLKSSSDLEDTFIGYHRSNLESLPKEKGNTNQHPDEIKSPEVNVQLFRASGAFPSYAPDASKLAFVDNEFRTLYVIDVTDDGKANLLKPVLMETEANSIFAPIWSNNKDKDTLYICKGPAFTPDKTVDICAITNACTDEPQEKRLIANGFNNAFPCTDPQGKRLVFRSTMDGGEKRYKNLYIIENLESMENGKEEAAKLTRLTSGNWIDTHCVWSPSGEWIAFASNRDRNSDELDHNLDTGRFAVYLVNPNGPDVLKTVAIQPEVPRAIERQPISVRVIASRCKDLAGHVNHPVFSPDGKSLAVVADLAAVSCDPISLPHFIHSVRPYGDLFVVDIDSDDIEKNRDIEEFRRVTHSRYENSTAVWTNFSCTHCPLYKSFREFKTFLVTMNRAHADGGETRHVSGHLCIARRSC